jgi:hypothetical protein
MALWSVLIGSGGTQKTQDRVVDITVDEEFGIQKFTVIVKTPLASERSQAKGRIDDALIQIIRGSTTLLDGFIEDVESGADYVKYTGRSFIMMLGYSPNSETDGTSGDTKAEYSGDTGAVICDDLIDEFCHHVNGSATVRDSTLTYSDITFSEVFDGEVKIHGAQKVYDVIKNMCYMYGKDVWSDATWAGTTLTNKNIHIGDRSRGSSGSPHKTLTGGVNIADIPIIKYRSSQTINCLRVLGRGSGKEQISVWVEDATSIAAIGAVEGVPYRSNLILSEDTAKSVGDAIILAKKDPIVELKVVPVNYIYDLKYGDWVKIVDTYSGIDTTKRIKKISHIHRANNVDSMRIDIGDKFDNYENIIRDLTKGDVNEEPEMTQQGGSLRITANDPPDTFVRHDPGMWYDTTGAFQESGKGVCPFWTYADNPATGTYKKALIQISDTGTVSYKVGSQEVTTGAAQSSTVSPDATNTPLGWVILKGGAAGGGGYVVEGVYSDDQGESYIYRDVRPIVGSSSTGYGGDPVWEKTGTPEYARLITAQDIDLQDKILHFHKTVSNMRIYRSGDNLIINPASTASSIGLGGILSADYGISNCNGITMYNSSADIDMNYAEIFDSGDVTLYDSGSLSPKLSLKVPVIESAGGAYLVANDNNFWINAIGGSVLAKCVIDTKKWEFSADVEITGDIDLLVSNITGITYLKSYYSTGLDVKNSAGTSMITLGDTTYGAILDADIDMDHNDILDCKDINIK